MNLTAAPVLLAGLLMLACSLTRADGFVTLEIGQGDIDIDKTGQLPFEPIGSSGDHALAFGVSGGYQFDSGVYVDLAFTDLDTVTLFGFTDAIGLSAMKLGVGYRLQTNESFSFLGKIGLSFWGLDARESFLFNPGPEQSGSVDGTDLFVEVGGQYQFNEQFALTLTHSRHAYDLGDTTATRVGIKYTFSAR